MAKERSCYVLKWKEVREEYLNDTNDWNFRKSKQKLTKNKDEVFTKLYRYMLRPDIYYVAYKNLYANSGASTRGVDNDTADGFGEKR